MKTSAPFILVVCGCICLMLVSCVPEHRANSLSNQLHGAWRCVNLWEGGKQVGEPERSDTTLYFQDNTVAATTCGSTVTGRYQIVTGSFPAAIDIIYAAPDKQRRIPAIVEISGKKLKLCHPESEEGSRPLKFEATSETVLAIFKKEME